MKASELKEGTAIVIPSLGNTQKVNVVSVLQHQNGYIAARFDNGETIFFDSEADIVLDKKDDET